MGAPPRTAAWNPIPYAELSELLLAPTLEGYAARHSKLAKSVTFDREPLSPPGAATPALGVPLMPPPHASPLMPGRGPQLAREPAEAPPLQESTTAAAAPDKADNVEVREDKREEKRDENGTQKIIKSLDEHEYFGTALLAIKQVISAHLQEMHVKFQARFDRLEAEVRSRDVVIGRLRQHIQDLERSLDEEYTASASDSASSMVPAWDSASRREALELGELPEALRPAPWRADAVVLELDSTDTDADADEPALHAATWELELLAAQMRRQRRSHSFDAAAPRRRLLCRGYSADHKD